MEEEGNLVSGGVTLIHTECEGKHSYEVKGFLNHNKGMFTSEGDKLIMINKTNVKDLTPEAFAGLLVEGCPLLTIHHPSKTKTEECKSEELRVNKKESTVISFSLKMVRESELEACADQEPSISQQWDEDGIEDDSFDDGNLVIVSMADTSFNMLVARGCDPDNPCSDCGKMNCQLNKVVVQPARAEITPRCSGKFCLDKVKNNLFLKSFMGEKYVYPFRRRLRLNNTMSEPITIYYYKPTTACSTLSQQDVPVVLNFTNTENVFCCTAKHGEDTKILTVVQCRQADLQTICADDPRKWSFVFYMSSERDGLRRFESALHRGWFIHTKSEVDMCKDQSDSKTPNNFFFIIQSGEC